MRLFSKKITEDVKYDKNLSHALGYRLVCHIFVLTHFDVISNLLTGKRRTEFANYSRVACDLRVLLVFSQHPAWFSSL